MPSLDPEFFRKVGIVTRRHHAGEITREEYEARVAEIQAEAQAKFMREMFTARAPEYRPNERLSLGQRVINTLAAIDRAIFRRRR